MAESLFLVLAYALRGYGGGRNNLTEAQRHRGGLAKWWTAKSFFFGWGGGVMVDFGSGGRTSLHTAETAMPPLFCDKKSNFKTTLVLYQKLDFGLLNVARASHFRRRGLQAGSLHV
jgi:hypothetical protein